MAKKQTRPATDPIFAAIERQQKLWAQWNRVIDRDGDDEAHTAYHVAFDALLAIRPTTRAGVAALIEHCRAEGSRFPSDAEGGNAKTLLRTLAEAMPALA